ncbi:MAG: hypothetical protein GVY19_06560 [Bacteroidetes bacterium]|nr:hypothetical protein [Bacteroidota bacterium]
MKKTYTVAVETIINRPGEVVFDYVSQLKNQVNYSVWLLADPHVKTQYKGKDGTVGFIASWQSNKRNVGEGEQEITHITPGDRYDVEIRFEKPFKATSQAYTKTLSIDGNSTRVVNVFLSSTPFPICIGIPFIKQMLKKDMKKNLANLKEILEQ